MSSVTWNKYSSSSVKEEEEEEETASVQSAPKHNEVDEHLPLLQGFKRTSSINGFKSYE